MNDENTEQGSRVQHKTIDADSAGQRLDNYLLRELKGVPRTRIYRACRKGEVRINKGRVKPDYRVKAGDVLRIPPIRVPEPSQAPTIARKWSELLTRSVVYEDKGLLVINKPSGLAVHGGSGLSYGLIECLRQMRPDDRYLELVHRIDRDTSGCIMIAKRRPVLREIHRQLREGTVDKRYLALVAGHWPKQCRVVDAPLFKFKLPSGESLVRVAKEGKAAVTRFSIVERFANATLIEAKPVTGRTHQIRVHAQHVGFPLLGDDKYSSDEDREFCKKIGLKRLFLHARFLGVGLPEQGRVEIDAPLDGNLESILGKLRN
ncbi:MAG: 23S rRNA pseudouridine(955/2504/2580) synthase RluC [Proteobacteria bacterium]|nr:23S rRNA pseudouridine(955/2504/2580) synthase RluC [Pseudomonadota bacterium]